MTPILVCGLLLITIPASDDRLFPPGAGRDTSDSARCQPVAELVREILVANLPREIEEKPNWGKTVRIANGLELDRDGGSLRLRVKKKEVPHGLWQHYRLRLVDPKRDLSISITKPQRTPGGAMSFDIQVQAKLDAYARLLQYANGVKLLSIDTRGVVEATLVLHCEVSVEILGAGFLSEVSLHPRIAGAEVKLTNIDLNKVGHLRGKPATELGDHFRKFAERQLERKEDKIVKKGNKALEKAETAGKLRLSLHRWLMQAI